MYKNLGSHSNLNDCREDSCIALGSKALHALDNAKHSACFLCIARIIKYTMYQYTKYKCKYASNRLYLSTFKDKYLHLNQMLL